MALSPINTALTSVEVTHVVENRSLHESFAVDIGKGAKYSAAAIATRRTSQKMTSGDSEVTQLHKVPVFGKARGERSRRRGEKGYFRSMGTDFQRFYDSGSRAVRAFAERDGKRLVGRAAPAGHAASRRGSSQKPVFSLPGIFAICG